MCSVKFSFHRARVFWDECIIVESGRGHKLTWRCWSAKVQTRNEHCFFWPTTLTHVTCNNFYFTGLSMSTTSHIGCFYQYILAISRHLQCREFLYQHVKHTILTNYGAKPTILVMFRRKHISLISQVQAQAMTGWETRCTSLFGLLLWDVFLA